MTEKPQPYYGTWINRQRSLLPGLDEELDPLTAKLLEQLIIILDTSGWVPSEATFSCAPSEFAAQNPRNGCMSNSSVVICGIIS